ncbi:MAG: NAD-dependent epimerase/dehydratase family protein [Comamonadaceae bacterium]|nr:NAD-dependent epimerase/dehydratase family protein [Comamonadaceae bacterium]
MDGAVRAPPHRRRGALRRATRRWASRSAKPLAYYANNLGGLRHRVRRRCSAHGCRRFVFSSSATVYGDPAAAADHRGRAARRRPTPTARPS